MEHHTPRSQEYDVFIIGGGINGVGIAADAAGRGLKVGLCEKQDLGNATSSASSKLIHGGLRYLEQYHFNLVRKSLVEQNHLLHNAPHLIEPQAFILPHCPWLRPYWMIRVGLFFYDHLNFYRTLPKTQVLDFTHDNRDLQPQFKRGFQYFDCKTDDSRLVCHVALLANLCSANILPRHEIVHATRTQKNWILQIRNVLTNETHKILTKCVINVTGPWVEQVAQNILHVLPKFKVQLVKGSHIIVPKLTHHSLAYLLQNRDHRVIFVIPYQKKFHLIGTTDVPISDMEASNVSDEEKQYLCESVNQFMNKQITPKDIVNEFWGVRALQANSTNAQQLSRDYAVDINDELAPCIHILGGKLTTYRALSEQVVTRLKKYFPHLSAPWTANAKLPGGEFQSFANLQLQLKNQYPWLPNVLKNHLSKNYGTRAFTILDSAASIEDLGIQFGECLYQKEVDYLVQTEWAKTDEDILWRRTKCGLTFNKQQSFALQQYLQQR